MKSDRSPPWAAGAPEAVGGSSEPEVNRLLEQWRGGDEQALDQLLPLVYQDLRQLAAGYLRSERAGFTLEPTGLINEAFLRLLGPTRMAPVDRAHFFALAARAMRRVLVDRARRLRAGKRPDPRNRLTLKSSFGEAQPEVDVLALHEALERLASIHRRQARLVEMRYFGGLSNQEAAVALSISLATVERDWQVARRWLAGKLGEVADG